jgi:hypothetical protein
MLKKVESAEVRTPVESVKLQDLTWSPGHADHKRAVTFHDRQGLFVFAPFLQGFYS